MSIKEYMKSRNVSRQTIYNRMEKGLLKTVKDGNKIYIVKEFSNSRKISKINSEAIDFRAIQEFMEIIKNSNDILKKFQDVFMPIFQYVHDLNRYQAAYILPEGGKQVTHRDLLEELKQGTPFSFRELMREHLNAHYIKVLGISY